MESRSTPSPTPRASAVNSRVSEYTVAFKNAIKTWITEHGCKVIGHGNTDKTSEFMRFVFDYDAFTLSQEDIVPRQRQRPIVLEHERCVAICSNGVQCSRKRQMNTGAGTDYENLLCNTHNKYPPKQVIRSGGVGDDRYYEDSEAFNEDRVIEVLPCENPEGGEGDSGGGDSESVGHDDSHYDHAGGGEGGNRDGTISGISGDESASDCQSTTDTPQPSAPPLSPPRSDAEEGDEVRENVNTYTISPAMHITVADIPPSNVAESTGGAGTGTSRPYVSSFVNALSAIRGGGGDDDVRGGDNDGVGDDDGVASGGGTSDMTMSSMCTGSTSGTGTGSRNSVIRRVKINIWVQDIQGIQYYIDKFNNIYSTEDILANAKQPRVIGKWSFDEEHDCYVIPSFADDTVNVSGGGESGGDEDDDDDDDDEDDYDEEELFEHSEAPIRA